MFRASELPRLFAAPSVRPMPPRRVVHPRRTPNHSRGMPLVRQVRETPSDARAGAVVPILANTIQVPRAAARMPRKSHRDRAPRCTAFCRLRHARLCGQREADADRRYARSPEPARASLPRLLTAGRTSGFRRVAHPGLPGAVSRGRHPGRALSAPCATGPRVVRCPPLARQGRAWPGRWAGGPSGRRGRGQVSRKRRGPWAYQIPARPHPYR
jgi:hypothetical protein